MGYKQQHIDIYIKKGVEFKGGSTRRRQNVDDQEKQKSLGNVGYVAVTRYFLFHKRPSTKINLRCGALECKD